MKSISRNLLACCFFSLLSLSSLTAATNVLDNVNIVNAETKNAWILLTGNDPESFPYDQAYGLTNYWTKWDLIQNDDGTYSFHLNSKYISAAADGDVGVATSIGDNEKFYLQRASTKQGYYLITYWGTYISSQGTGWKDLVQTRTATASEEWYFFSTVDASTLPQDVNLSNFLYKGVIILLTGNDPETFPYDQAYGPNNYWTKWDLIDNGDGTHSFHLNGKYLSVDTVDGVVVTSSIGAGAKFTLIEESKRYHIQSFDGNYLASAGTGWKDVIIVGEQSTATQWYLFDRDYPTIETIDPLFGTQGWVDEDARNVTFSETFTGTPALFADMQTFNGSDPAGLRTYNVADSGFTVFVEEEQSNDTELTHNDETIAFAGFKPGFIENSAGDKIGEVGRVSLTQDSGGTWFTQEIDGYTNPIVIMQINTYNGSHASHIRLTQVKSTYFKYQLEEWDYLDGSHAEETVAFMVMEAGVHTLADGTVIQAQTQRINHNWEYVNFASTFASTPIVFSQSQSRDGNASIVTRQRSITQMKVEVRLQEQEADNGTHDNETVGVISIL